MRRCMRALATLATAGAVIGVGSAAQAAPHHGSCPGPFQPYTLQEFIALAESASVPRENAESTFEFVNRNEDAVICVQNLSSEKRPHEYNFIDNNAR